MSNDTQPIVKGMYRDAVKTNKTMVAALLGGILFAGPYGYVAGKWGVGSKSPEYGWLFMLMGMGLVILGWAFMNIFEYKSDKHE